jgi:DnaK suppressor protein
MNSAPALNFDTQRQRLQLRAEELRQELQGDRNKMSALVDSPLDQHDRQEQANLVGEVQLSDAEFRRDLGELAAVEAALQRLDHGRYGWCEDCSESIAADRLAAQPWASRCLACQERHERQSAAA